MKILMVNKFLHPNGGSETYIFKLGDYLKSVGHEVEYFGMEHEKRIVGNSAEAYVSNVDFHKASKLDKLVYPLKTIYSKEARKKMAQVLETFNPDAVHINNFNFQLTPSIILAIKQYRKKTGKKVNVIFTAHDPQLVCPNHRMKNPITGENCKNCIGGQFTYCIKGKCIHGSTIKSVVGAIEAYFWSQRGVYKNIDTIICCSHFMKTIMDTNPLFSKKTIALHNFCDEVTTTKGEKKNYVLYFGRFSEEKGIDTLIEVCKELKHINFIFAGKGPLEEVVNNVSNITNVGFQAGKNLEKLIKEAMFSLCPSQCYENCPFSVIESQLYGTPVIGADIGGIPELISVGKTGELFESGNAEELKRVIRKLYDDSNLLSEYTENCYNVKFNTIKKYVEELMKYYNA